MTNDVPSEWIVIREVKEHKKQFHWNGHGLLIPFLIKSWVFELSMAHSAKWHFHRRHSVQILHTGSWQCDRSKKKKKKRKEIPCSWHMLHKNKIKKDIFKNSSFFSFFQFYDVCYFLISHFYWYAKTILIFLNLFTTQLIFLVINHIHIHRFFF